MREIKFSELRSGPDSLFRSESAASTAIAAILLFGIIFSVFSAIHLGYVPEWKSETENSHMTDVWKDMTELKSKIDKTTLIFMSEPNFPTSNVTTIIPLHVGSQEIPLIGFTKFSGTVSVNKDQCNMTIIPANGYETIINCGTISYHSNNIYYVDQTFRYENGALILAQKEQAVMKLYPAIRVSEASPENYTFLINAVEIQGSENILSSSSDCSIRLKDYYFKPLYSENVNNFTLKIETDYPDVWEAYFREIMSEAGLEKDKDYTLNRTVDSTKNYSLNFLFPKEGSANSLKRLYIGKTAVNAELGIGLS